MNSAIGNFDSNGARMAHDQMSENNEILGVDHGVNWYKSKLLSANEEIKRLQSIIDRKTQLIPDVAPETNVLDVFNYIDKEKWDTFGSLAIAMLANGATLYELQQRLMGLAS